MRIVLLTSRIPHNLNLLGETALFLGGTFCLEYPSRRSEKVIFYFANYRFSFRFTNYSKPLNLICYYFYCGECIKHIP